MADTVFIKGDTAAADYTPTADIAPGQVVIVGNIPMIHNRLEPFVYDAGRPNRMVGLARRGGYYMVAAAAGTQAGTRVFWDNTNKRVTTTATSNKHFGITGNVAAVNDGDQIPVEHQPQGLAT